MSKLPPWSYSMLDAIETCPRQAYHKYILREREPETEAQRWGTEVHKHLEENVRDGKELPASCVAYAPLAESVRRIAAARDLQVLTEHKMGVTDKLRPCEFFAPEVWGRGVADVALLDAQHAWLGDWKTGKTKEKDFQVKVFAALAFATWPHLEQITACNLWLKTGMVGQPYVFFRKDAAQMWAGILQRVEAAERMAATDQPWPCRPNGLCREWCGIKSCAHNGRK